MGGISSSEDVRGANLAGSTPPFLGRERAAVGFFWSDVDVYYYIRWRLKLEGETFSA